MHVVSNYETISVKILYWETFKRNNTISLLFMTLFLPASDPLPGSLFYTSDDTSISLGILLHLCCYTCYLLSVFQTEVNMLRGEVAQLKSLLLAHRNCPIFTQQRESGQISLETGLTGRTSTTSTCACLLLFLSLIHSKLTYQRSRNRCCC